MILIYSNLTPVPIWVVIGINMILFMGVMCRIVPGTASGCGYRHPRETMDPAAGDRLRHRSERGRAVCRQSGPGVFVHDRAIEDRRTARQSQKGAGQQVFVERVSQYGSEYRHRAARVVGASGGCLYPGVRQLDIAHRPSAILEYR